MLFAVSFSSCGVFTSHVLFFFLFQKLLYFGCTDHGLCDTVRGVRYVGVEGVSNSF